MNPLSPHSTSRTSRTKRILSVSLLLLPIAFVPAHASVIYSFLKDFGIPTDFVGVYLDIDTGNYNYVDDPLQADWDINPFFGGQGVANSAAFQPARSCSLSFAT